ncbi:fatty-acid amide hydrolase 2-B-like isoform X1 [Zerene cesonia]|uniref:fatty-acid amide hydrolase 2-B-like isoform X1 n=2 Tax=Zerene cesonia TaxID=33412 RepID=UPI0018E5749F|nr:fatty-acid amide hydrolase 2-B-like isoform X1 [Zerene cesonia]
MIKRWFNFALVIFSRVVLVIISASVYNVFILIEILLNNTDVWYPETLLKRIEKIHKFISNVSVIVVKNISIQNFMMNAFMQWFLRFLVSLLAIIVYPLTLLINIKRNKKCPPPSNPILFKSATTLSMMIRNKQITSEAVVSAYIDRCKEVNPYINAIVEPRYDVALKEARAIDKMISSNDRSPEQLAKEFPLLGVPMTVKESIAVGGMSNDCGTVYPYRKPATKDADIVRLAREAGAIPIAVTNTPQLCMNWETYNNVSGLTMNPYDQKRTTGGSSGGESALIAAAASVIGVGSDIAGSLRLPPMFNGIFGHKPTPHLWSIKGHVPDSLDPTFEEYFALGPIARYAEDLTLLLKVLKQPGAPDVPFDKPVDITRLKFYYMEGDGGYVMNKIGPDVKKAMNKAKNYIKSTYNVDVQELKIQNLHHMWEISVRVLFKIRHVANIYTDPNERDQLISMWPEILKKLFGISDHSLTCVLYGPVQKFFDKLPENYYQNLVKTFEQIKQDFYEVLSNDAVLFFPSFPSPAHLHYRIFYKFLNCGYLTMFNALGLPSTNCPLGLTDKGLPVGMQIVANKCNDHLTIAVAKEFEKAFGGWVPPNKDFFDGVKTA